MGAYATIAPMQRISRSSVVHEVGGAALWADDRPERLGLPSPGADGVGSGDDQWDEHRGEHQDHDRDGGEIAHGCRSHFSARSGRLEFVMNLFEGADQNVEMLCA